MVKLLLVDYCIDGESSSESYFHVADGVAGLVDDGDVVDSVEPEIVIAVANDLVLGKIVGKMFVVVVVAVTTVSVMALSGYKYISASFVLLDSSEIVAMLWWLSVFLAIFVTYGIRFLMTEPI